MMSTTTTKRKRRKRTSMSKRRKRRKRRRRRKRKESLTRKNLITALNMGRKMKKRMDSMNPLKKLTGISSTACRTQT